MLGRHALGPIILRGSDIFNYYSNNNEIPIYHTISVVPALIKIRHLPIFRQKLLPEIGSIPSLVYKGRDFDFQGVRNYQLGDEVRSINWRVTAKFNQLATNEYALVQSARVFIIFDQTAFFIVGGLISIILIVMVNGKAEKFIQMEITETVRRAGEQERGFLRRNNLDLIFFIVGFGTLVLVLLQELGISFDLGVATILLALLGPFLFWIGGAAVVARLAVWIPSKTDPIVKRIGFLKDVSILIKGNRKWKLSKLI